MRNPNDPNDNTEYPDDQNTPPGGQNPSTYQLVGYDANGRPIYADNQGNQFTWSSPDNTWHPYEGDVLDTQNHDGVNTAPTPVTPPPPPTGGGGGGNLSAPPTSQFPAFDEPFTPPPNTPLPEAPGFTPPEFVKPPAFSFADFTQTNPNDVFADQGYKFRLDQGRDQLEHGAAARGILNTGMTLKDILDYGQQSASQEFQNVDARRRGDYTMNRGNAVDTYNTNYKSQYLDPYEAKYKGAYDTFGGQMDAWKTNAGFTERANQFGSNQSYNKWVQDALNWYKEQDMRWGRARDVLTA